MLALLKAEAGIAEAVAREGVFVGIDVFNFFLEVFEVFVKNFGSDGGVFAQDVVFVVFIFVAFNFAFVWEEARARTIKIDVARIMINNEASDGRSEGDGNRNDTENENIAGTGAHRDSFKLVTKSVCLLVSSRNLLVSVATLARALRVVTSWL